MYRFVRICLHIIVIAAGLTAAAFADPWNWALLHNLVLPIVATGFFLYLVVFLISGAYRVFYSPADRE